MAEEKKQPTAEVNQSVIIQVQHKRTHKQSAGINRNYPLLSRGKEIIIRNYNGIKTIIQRNYRRLGY